jgi:exosortase
MAIYDGTTGTGFRGRWFHVLVLLPLGLLWFVLIHHLQFEWAVNPQYSFGWAMPLLCAFLAWRNSEKQNPGTSRAGPVSGQEAGILWQEANPEWRLVSWALAAIVTGLTLSLMRRVFGLQMLRRLMFPVLFFLVAVPWPTVIEAPVIQNLARFNAAGAVEVLNLTGTPAFRRGNIIEIGTGIVGIEDACSGIRSFK